MKEIKTTDAVGHVLCHDVTEIVKDKVKHSRFRKGHVITEEDIPVLLNLGKENIYVWEKQQGMLHEDEAAEIMASLCINENMTRKGPKEGKIDIFADADGLLVVDVERLREVNTTSQMIIATRFTGTPVKKGEQLAGTRIIPLIIEKEKMDDMVKRVGTKPLLELLPFKPMKAAIITTGSEVYHGRIKDTFTPVVKAKLENYGVQVTHNIIVDDDKEKITNTIMEMKTQGADFILCTGGMSVDPDDRTPGAIKATGANIVSYGAPVLPGAMFLLGYFDDGAVVAGLPGCVMYHTTTVFDLILPKIVAGIKLNQGDVAGLGHGGLCLVCETCNWPICSLGKGI